MGKLSGCFLKQLEVVTISFKGGFIITNTQGVFINFGFSSLMFLGTFVFRLCRAFVLLVFYV